MQRKPDQIIPALYGGIIMGLLTTIPFLNLINCLCCAGIILGGVAAVFFYKNNFTPDTPPFTVGDCLIVGLLAGLVGAAVDAILSAVLMAAFGNVMQEFVLQLLRDSSFQLPDEAFQNLEKAFQHEVTLSGILTNFVLGAVVSTLFGMVGGAIGYSFFKPKPPLTMPPPSPPPVAP